MIRELVGILERETGAKLEPERVMRIETEFCMRFAGERVPALRKAVTMQPLIEIGTGLPTTDAARKLGVSVRTVQRARKLLQG